MLTPIVHEISNQQALAIRQSWQVAAAEAKVGTSKAGSAR